MSAVFADTVGLLAIWDKSDQWHEAAKKAYATLVDERQPLVTTSYVLLECGNSAARRPFRGAVERLRQALERGGLLIRPTEEDWYAAWIAYGRGDAGAAGIVDHVSFAVMRRRGITRAFTNDHYFRAAQFETLF